MENTTNSPFGNSPFGTEDRYRPRFSLNGIFLLIVVNSAVCTMLLLGGRVPMIANTVNDFLGRPRTDAGQVDRTMHLVFLMACYTAPLAVTAVVSWLYLGISHWRKHESLRLEQEREPSSPFE